MENRLREPCQARLPERLMLMLHDSYPNVEYLLCGFLMDTNTILD